jgi:hypothetical protein
MELPRSLSCLNLAHSIDDRDVVEQLLTYFPEEMERCIPTALRSILEVDYLPAVPFFSKPELINYLSRLWDDSTYNYKLGNVAAAGLIYLIAYYLDRGANIHALDDDNALRYAAENGHIETVKLLLDRKADIHAMDDYALRYAAHNGHTETVKLLLDRGANIHALHARGMMRLVKMGIVIPSNYS